jgi:hypothetical protein
MSHENRYLETVENDAGALFDVVRVCVPRSTATVYAGVDLTSPTAPAAGDARLVARLVADALQEAVAEGALVLP